MISFIRKKNDLTSNGRCEFNFQQFSFFLGIAYSADFWLPEHHFILGSSFLLKILRFIAVLSKMKYI